MNDDEIPDVQSREDERGIFLQNVGITYKRMPLTLKDRTNEMQSTVATFEMGVSVGRLNKGAHMSRFVEVLEEYKDRGFSLDGLTQMAEMVRNEQNAESAKVIMEFPYYIQKLSPVTKISAHMYYDCMFSASTNDGQSMGVYVPVMLLCPCSKEMALTDEEGGIGKGAHNQRTMIQLTVKPTEFVWIEELIELVEAESSVQMYPLLKRADEKFVTIASYENPKFVEDMARDIQLAIEKDGRFSQWNVRVQSQESIHAHDAFVTQGGSPHESKEE